MPRRSDSLVPCLVGLLLLGLPGVVLAKAPAEPASGAAAAQEDAPEGFRQLVVDGIATTPVGPAVVLTDAEHSVLLPIWLGESEAATISLRTAEQTAPRPLTHDLLDQVIAALGGRVTEVRLDSLDERTFTAQVSLRTKKGKTVVLDARASDAIALALGHGVPIWVSDGVVEEAGLAPNRIVNPEEDVPMEIPLKPGVPL